MLQSGRDGLADPQNPGEPAPQRSQKGARSRAAQRKAEQNAKPGKRCLNSRNTEAHRQDTADQEPKREIHQQSLPDLTSKENLRTSMTKKTKPGRPDSRGKNMAQQNPLLGYPSTHRERSLWALLWHGRVAAPAKHVLHDVPRCQGLFRVSGLRYYPFKPKCVLFFSCRRYRADKGGCAPHQTWPGRRPKRRTRTRARSWDRSQSRKREARTGAEAEKDTNV